jgi:hypothetical protein
MTGDPENGDYLGMSGRSVPLSRSTWAGCQISSWFAGVK